MLKSRFGGSPVKIKVIGIGGGGCNAVTRMVREQISGVDFLAVNTDIQHLAITEVPVRLAIGEKLTHGLGAGGDQTIGRKCAENSLEEIKQVLQGSDMVFLAAGLGGGTGTGATPVVAEIARECGALVVAVTTKPFGFEGRRRMEVAEEGIKGLVNKVDTLISISNDQLLKLPDRNTTVDNAFKAADEILSHAVQTIVDLIKIPGLINIDFASVKNIMRDAGPAWMSRGRGTGPNPALAAARDALNSPLLDVSIKPASKVLFRITGGSNLTLAEVNNAAGLIQKSVQPDANIVFGVNVDLNMKDEVRVTLIATGLKTQEKAVFAKDLDKTTPLFRR
jgi:cell division protein FtsZ